MLQEEDSGIFDSIEPSLKSLDISDDGTGLTPDVGIGSTPEEPSIPNPNLGEVEASDSVCFFPPAYIQRYSTVRDVLVQFLASPYHKDCQNGNTVMEVGCAEFGMIFHFKNIIELGKVIFMDIDEKLLAGRKQNLMPLPAEQLRKVTRPKPLVIQAYAGCITKVDSRIINENPPVWAVVAIELIEHLYPDVLRGFEISVFGVISPSIVIVTTPNSDFNTVFNLPSGKFRHWDHKFEWSRQEFVLWCEKICMEFTQYKYKIAGICAGPPETSHLGCVSQMAVFEKNNMDQSCSAGNKLLYPGIVQDNIYKLIESVEYPNYIETRTDPEIVLQELQYILRFFWLTKKNREHYMECDVTELYFPLKELESVGEVPGIVRDMDLLIRVISPHYEVREKDGIWVAVIPVSLWVSDHEKDDSDVESEPDELMEHNSVEVADSEGENWDAFHQ